ncbi:MAG: ABC transporter ATP-binding protein [Phycisphaerae bacterium]|nr:ABC transporter ATP-binding protein [Phycisphaerae bacterium]
MAVTRRRQQPKAGGAEQGSTGERQEDPDESRQSLGSKPEEVTPTLVEGIPPEQMSNFRLLIRMFEFVGPVKYLAILACILVALATFVDISTVNLTRLVINNVSTVVGATVKLPVSTLTARKVTVPSRSKPAASSSSSGASFIQEIQTHFTHGPLRTTINLIGLLALFVAASTVVTFFRWFVNSKLSMDMVFSMRASMYDQLQRVGFSFHDRHSSGTLINRSLSDLHNIRQFVNMALVQITEIVLYIVGYNILLASISPTVGLVALLPIPFWFTYLRYFSKKAQPIQKQIMTSGDELTMVLSENVAGAQVVKAFATEKTEISKYDKTADRLFDRVLKNVGLFSNFVPIVRSIATASSLSLFLVGSFLCVSGSLKVGDLIVFGVAMGNILGRLQQLNQISNQYQTSIVSARRFYEVMLAQPSVMELPDAAPLPPGSGQVEFTGVSFTYSGAVKPVLENVSFRAAGGSVVALVGPTGAGKSTMMQLLARFYDPDQGVISMDGADIKTVSLSSLRKSICFVFQETFLFSDTVANNIRYGSPQATDGAVEAAARIAQAHDFIMELSNGYQTLLGERGTTLSGGQRQRLAIARALMADPKILVLDEALAAIDPETEHLIRRGLELVLTNRTVFVIAHRLSTVRAANLILVLEHGRLTQMGTHEQLMRQPGHYREVAVLQLSGDEPSFPVPPGGPTVPEVAL